MPNSARIVTRARTGFLVRTGFRFPRAEPFRVISFPLLLRIGSIG
jgi:hypothetical protein